jgi:hypothetical protein
VLIKEVGMNSYIVERPVRGVHILIVKANSAKEAKEKVNGLGLYGCADTDEIQGVQQSIDWVGKANKAVKAEKP